MTKKELEEQNRLYKAYVSEWRFFIRSYFGGKMYKNGDYLLQHAFESQENFNRRKKIAYFYNYCAPVVDIFVAHLFATPPTRDFGGLEKDELFKSFLEDADLTGNTFSQFMREVGRFASVYGHVYVVVDKPAVNTVTKQDQIEDDIRPYFSIITPENVFDWKMTRLPNGRVVLDSIKIRESIKPDRYRIWNREGWELWEVSKKGGTTQMVDSGKHGLGEVPGRVVYNKNSGIDGIGLSDIQDIADVNKNIYYLCSDAKEIIENTAFPMLAMPEEDTSGADDEGEQAIGPRNILTFDKEKGQPYWLEPPHSSLAEIREWIQQDITEIFRIAKMSGMKTTDESVQPWSGVALTVQNQQLMAALHEKADNMQQAEIALLELWAKWEKKKFEGKIEYPTNFAVQDMNNEFNNAVTALGVSIDSMVYNKEIQKKIVKTTLPKLDQDTKEKIFNEIDTAVEKTEVTVVGETKPEGEGESTDEQAKPVSAPESTE